MVMLAQLLPVEINHGFILLLLRRLVRRGGRLRHLKREGATARHIHQRERGDFQPAFGVARGNR